MKKEMETLNTQRYLQRSGSARIKKRKYVIHQITGHGHKYPIFSIPRPRWMTDSVIPPIPIMNGSTNMFSVPTDKWWDTLSDWLSQWLFYEFDLNSLWGFYINHIDDHRVYFHSRWGAYDQWRKFIRKGGRVYKQGSMPQKRLSFMWFEFYGILIDEKYDEMFHDEIDKVNGWDEWHKNPMESKMHILAYWMEKNNVPYYEYPKGYEENFEDIYWLARDLF